MKLKFIGIVVMLWFTLVMPAARSVGEVYPIATNEDILKNVVGMEGDLTVCGNYFISRETVKGKVLYFGVGKNSPMELPPLFDFSKINGVLVQIDKRFISPKVLVLRGTWGMVDLVVGVDAVGYLNGLPCLADPYGLRV